MSTGTTPWSQGTRDRWFFAALAASFLSLVWLFWPYAAVLMFACVFVVVTWPLYARLVIAFGGRRGLASLATVGILAIVVLGPMGLLFYAFALEALAVVQLAIDSVQSGRLEEWFAGVLLDLQLMELDEWVAPLLPEGMSTVQSFMGPLRVGAFGMLTAIGNGLPGLVNALAGGGLGFIIFLFTTITLYMEGPRVLDLIRNLSPMDDVYEERLFHVFREFARNLVVGSLATAAVQGVVAAIGYWIAGADRVLFLGILTSVFAFVPMIGTLVVWLPTAFYVAAQHGLFWGLFVAGWSLLFTGTVDNFLKPFFLRGSSDIHPLLIFLAVFGGLGAMGLPGLLVGPMCVAFFLALYTMYTEDYLGIPRAVAPVPSAPGRLGRLYQRFFPKPTVQVQEPSPVVAVAPQIDDKPQH
ncbi:MAG: AI-2E family transporter [Deltaproteobacteria bacterium]|nr:AI-2E family transporter [Deltaproteobacteria bacterium]